MFKMKPKKVGKFKEFMAMKLTEASGKVYKPEDILVNNIKDKQNEFIFYRLTKEEHYKYIFGDVTFVFYNSEELKDVEYIYGDVSFVGSTIRRLGKLKHIQGNIDSLYMIEDLGKLKSIGGDALLIVNDLKELEYVGGSFQSNQIQSLGKLRYVGGDLALRFNCYLRSLNNLEYVGGNLNLTMTSITDLGNLQYVGGELFLTEKQKVVFEDKIINKNGKFYFKNTHDYVFDKAEVFKIEYEDDLLFDDEFKY